MKCEACERGDHLNCGMQTWCECECAGPDSIEFGGEQEFPRPGDVIGHKTFDTGERCPETGMPLLRHEPLTRAEGEALWEAAKAAEAKRAADMPDEQSAIRAMFSAWQRLKELGWREGKYAPRDGTMFKTIELGSMGIFDCDCHGEWPNCTWTTYDSHDAYPSSKPPAMFKLLSEDQAKYDARMAEAQARYANS
jgi:hypothetical protein